MVSVATDFPYTHGLNETFKSLLADEVAFKQEQENLLETSVDIIEGGSKYKLSVTLEAQGEVQTIGLLCDEVSALVSEFRAIFHQYLGEDAPLYKVVEKRFGEKVESNSLDAVSYLVMVDKDVYWNIFVTLTYLR